MLKAISKTRPLTSVEKGALNAEAMSDEVNSQLSQQKSLSAKKRENYNMLVESGEDPLPPLMPSRPALEGIKDVEFATI